MKQHNVQVKCNPAHQLKEHLDIEKNIPLLSQVGGPCCKSTTIFLSFNVHVWPEWKVNDLQLYK